MVSKIGGKERETVQLPGVLTDIEYHIKKPSEESECSINGIIFDAPYSAAANDEYANITALGNIIGDKT